MTQVIRATFWTFRRTPQIKCFDFLQHTISPCTPTAGTSISERLLCVALPSDRRFVHFRSHSLRRREALVESDTLDGGSAGAEDADRKGRGRNEKKREARQAVRWGMDLASFPTPQIKRILKAASLEDEEIFGALMLVKRLGPDVKEGKRRQFNYIGKLLRHAQPEVLGALIQATKDGDYSTIEVLSGTQSDVLDEKEETDESESEEEEEEEDSQQFLAVANKWFDGLVNKDIDISNEVYSISDVEFDRQELRKLVRKVQSIEERPVNVEENEAKKNAELKTAQMSLTRFLIRLSKQILVEQYHVV